MLRDLEMRLFLLLINEEMTRGFLASNFASNRHAEISGRVADRASHAPAEDLQSVKVGSYDLTPELFKS